MTAYECAVFVFLTYPSYYGIAHASVAAAHNRHIRTKWQHHSYTHEQFCGLSNSSSSSNDNNTNSITYKTTKKKNVNILAI